MESENTWLGDGGEGSPGLGHPRGPRGGRGALGDTKGGRIGPHRARSGGSASLRAPGTPRGLRDSGRAMIPEAFTFPAGGFVPSLRQLSAGKSGPCPAPERRHRGYFDPPPNFPAGSRRATVPSGSTGGGRAEPRTEGPGGPGGPRATPGARRDGDGVSRTTLGGAEGRGVDLEKVSPPHTGHRKLRSCGGARPSGGAAAPGRGSGPLLA